MARFWQHMASPVVSPIEAASVPVVTSLPSPNTAVKQNIDLKAASAMAQRDWHFLEVGPEGLEEGTEEEVISLFLPHSSFLQRTSST